jgi:hypothetical protein
MKGSYTLVGRVTNPCEYYNHETGWGRVALLMRRTG